MLKPKNMLLKLNNLMAGLQNFILLICVAACPLYCQDINGEALEKEQIESFQRKATLMPPSSENTLPIIDAVDGMMRAIREQDMTRAYFAFTSKEFRRVTSLSDFTRFVKNSPVLIKNKSLATLKVMSYQTNAIYYAVGISQDGAAVNIKYDLILENGNWKVLGIQLGVKP